MNCVQVEMIENLRKLANTSVRVVSYLTEAKLSFHFLQTSKGVQDPSPFKYILVFTFN